MLDLFTINILSSAGDYNYIRNVMIVFANGDYTANILADCPWNHIIYDQSVLLPEGILNCVLSPVSGRIYDIHGPKRMISSGLAIMCVFYGVAFISFSINDHYCNRAPQI